MSWKTFVFFKSENGEDYMKNKMYFYLFYLYKLFFCQVYLMFWIVVLLHDALIFFASLKIRYIFFLSFFLNSNPRAMQMFVLNSWQLQDDKRSQLVLLLATSLILFNKYKIEIIEWMLCFSNLTLLTTNLFSFSS